MFVLYTLPVEEPVFLHFSLSLPIHPQFCGKVLVVLPGCSTGIQPPLKKRRQERDRTEEIVKVQVILLPFQLPRKVQNNTFPKSTFYIIPFACIHLYFTHIAIV